MSCISSTASSDLLDQNVDFISILHAQLLRRLSLMQSFPVE